MVRAATTSPKVIAIERTEFRAVQCEHCGAKMYPKSLLRPHLSRHERKELWFTTEVSKLQNTLSRMRDIA